MMGTEQYMESNMIYNDEVQHRLWDVELEILDLIHNICVENNIRYSLAYGTLLGAVRHKAFIPWDDDIDVMMPREDYNRFISLWDDVDHNGYVLIDEDCSPDYNNNFAKVRKDHTTFLQYWKQKERKFHKGIYVDIFPIDRKAPGLISTKLQYAFFALNLLYNRGYASKDRGKAHKIEKLLLTITPKRFYRTISKKAMNISQHWNKNQNCLMVAPNTMRDCKIYYPNNLFDHLITVSFEGKEYYAVANYDEALQVEYGDYMKLPPVEERVWKHHPVLIDFEHNIEELEI